MTSDERIEMLLNRFGQTIGDLPTPHVCDDDPGGAIGIKPAYPRQIRCAAANTAVRWHLDNADDVRVQDPAANWACADDYICHLADVIDRMEAALEAATRWAHCGTCEKLYICESANVYGSADCDEYQLSDNYLEGR